MIYYINAFQKADGASGKYLSYMLFSADSLNDLKKLVIKELKESWYDFLIEQNDDLADIEEMESFNDIGNRFKEAIHNYTKLGRKDLIEYDLLIFNYDTKIEESFKFYNRYSTIKADDNEHIDFYFYGDYYEKVQNIFPYFSKLYKDYKIKVTSETLNRNSDLIG